MKIIAHDGRTYVANSSAELVAQVHEMMGVNGTDADWMKTCAEGLEIQYGERVRCATPEEFTTDMIKLGRWKIADGGGKK